ncbi:MAG: hypothetical protein ABI651_01790 [Verrucomicrobiota bacterium]
MSENEPNRIGRREALKHMASVATAAATVPAVKLSGFGQTPSTNAAPARTLTDPELMKPAVPWQKILTQHELQTAAALCDLINEGMKDLRYIGNVPLVKFDGPPKEVLEYLKLI